MEIGVLADDGICADALQLVEVKTLQVPCLQAREGDAVRAEIGDDFLFYIAAVGTVGSRGYGTFDDEKPGLHVVGKGHVRGDFPIPRRPRRGYIFPAQLLQFLFRFLFVALAHRHAGGDPGLFSFPRGVFITEYRIIYAVFLLQVSCYQE